MSATPFPIEQFGGLSLRESAETVGASRAVALSNVDVDVPGMLRTRPGRSFFSTADSAAYSIPVYRVVNGDAVVTGAVYATEGAKLYEVKSGSIASATLAVNTVSTALGNVNLGADILVFGTPTTGSRVYTSDSNGLRYYSAGAFTNVGAATTPRGGFLAGSPLDARMVCAFSAINATPVPSRVHFSNPGLPETWTATDYVDLMPGDGEYITGIVTYNNEIIVFKQTRLFRFYGSSTATDGTAVFNFQAVSLGDRIGRSGSVAFPSGRFSADASGVYFTASRGVYRYAGGALQLISAGLGSSFTFDTTAAVTCVTADKLYVGDRSSPTYVMDKGTGEWTIYSVPMSAAADANALRSAYLFDATTTRLTKLDPAVSTDLGSALTWSYTSGLYSPVGDPSRVAISLESQIVGTGTATLKVATSGGSGSSSGVLDTGSAVTLGTAPVPAEGWQQIDREGAYWQHQLSGSGQASVNALTHYLSFVRPPGSW